jgi:hypothetical protein
VLADPLVVDDVPVPVPDEAAVELAPLLDEAPGEDDEEGEFSDDVVGAGVDLMTGRSDCWKLSW